VPARLELLGDPALDRGDPRLVEAGCVVQGELLLRDIGERGPAPQGKRLGEAALRDEPVEPRCVELLRLEADEVAGRARHDPVGAERPPQGVHVHLERATDARGGIFAPDGVDQPLARDRLVGVQQQHGEQRPRPLPPER